MDELKVFENPEFGKIRAIEKDGEPWFVAADVCRALELDDTGRATSRLDEDELTRIKIVSGGQNREVIAVNEPGLYSLVLGSRKPEAKAFKRWVTHDIIPSIRKHGAYMTPPTIEEILENPDIIIELATKLKEERAKRKEVEEQNRVLLPKGQYFDTLVERGTLTNFRTTAKEFGMKQKQFIKFLENKGFIYRDSQDRINPYNQHVTDGLFEIKEQYSQNNKWSGTQTLITPKGRETFRLLLGK